MKTRGKQPVRWGLVVMATFWMLIIVPLSAAAAPYAALVMDARSGEVLYSNNADTRLHPASLTKMMTLYVVFEAIENGEIGLDDKVLISKHAASEPPSKLGVRAGSSIALRYLIRAAAVKSANDAATALGEAIEGSEAQFARRMNRTAESLGMSRTTFKNAHGLTENGHLSTARDMSILGRHLFYDFPQYYNLFSRITTDAGVTSVSHTNRRLLEAYRGADGIKTGYTRAAGFNLTASAERNGERIIATVFGGQSTASRNAKVAELLDLGFKKAPTQVAVLRPARPPYLGKIGTVPVRIAAGEDRPSVAAKTVRLATAAAVIKSLRPQSRPSQAAPMPVIAARDDIERALLAAQQVATATPAQGSVAVTPDTRPEQRPTDIVLASAPAPEPEPEVVTRVSTSGGRHWGINVGRYGSEYKARQVLLQTALNEMATLDGSLRKVVQRPAGFDANFMGMTRESADLACRRLQAKKVTCFMIGPS
ncbi:D-alanyl-D-alanine carboxypeptidase family protein [Roseovarius sp. BRH_c41]|jgi:D-alanyl-D-alanine carboxypeptidase|uniref:D-alanyl-D-alanine carboxypeptidase family protein n=1 Tax=Roseovarius sp. BRH_c41 TaxID=1629709 RepID=UPI0005F12623|nr:D-alanyl-D-alanine carboxypeptidase family protein [Roseovarius sp. BRH_c41]KJS42916.1 MAG: D-Ala-D-Ala carboxypeptidase [Roseovarius sp. BRH_c41]KJS45623.1 MAG: D-Ala-D-Ala carboxypeptidase [Roseovarius sp. BRH_c41]